MLYLNNISELEVKIYYKTHGCVGMHTCKIPDCEIQSIGETTVMARYGSIGNFKEIPKQEVFDYINKGGYSDTPL